MRLKNPYIERTTDGRTPRNKINAWCILIVKQVPLKEAVGLRVNIMSCDGHLSSSSTDLEERGTSGWTAFFGLMIWAGHRPS